MMNTQGTTTGVALFHGVTIQDVGGIQDLVPGEGEEGVSLILTMVVEAFRSMDQVDEEGEEDTAREGEVATVPEVATTPTEVAITLAEAATTLAEAATALAEVAVVGDTVLVDPTTALEGVVTVLGEVVIVLAEAVIVLGEVVIVLGEVGTALEEVAMVHLVGVTEATVLEGGTVLEVEEAVGMAPEEVDTPLQGKDMALEGVRTPLEVEGTVLEVEDTVLEVDTDLEEVDTVLEVGMALEEEADTDLGEVGMVLEEVDTALEVQEDTVEEEADLHPLLPPPGTLDHPPADTHQLPRQVATLAHLQQDTLGLVRDILLAVGALAVVAMPLPLLAPLALDLLLQTGATNLFVPLSLPSPFYVNYE